MVSSFLGWLPADYRFNKHISMTLLLIMPILPVALHHVL